MELVKASTGEHWNIASNFLAQTVERCNEKGLPLWTHQQVSVKALKSHYAIENLYLLKSEQHTIGCVFISFDFDDFWADTDTKGALFFHKFAIGNAFNSKGFGLQALTAIRLLAEERGCLWVRCDCHGDRERLRAFYERGGFEFVDRQEMLGFDVARYQMLTICLRVIRNTWHF
ncbi:GNAT family N-acetyltransferase, partial [Vibrio parahaemolyticus]